MEPTLCHMIHQTSQQLVCTRSVNTEKTHRLGEDESMNPSLSVPQTRFFAASEGNVSPHEVEVLTVYRQVYRWLGINLESLDCNASSGHSARNTRLEAHPPFAKQRKDCYPVVVAPGLRCFLSLSAALEQAVIQVSRAFVREDSFEDTTAETVLPGQVFECRLKPTVMIPVEFVIVCPCVIFSWICKATLRPLGVTAAGRI